MTHEASELKFVATPEKGDVSALRVQPSNASHVLVLGHGASTNMRHANLQTIAERLAEVRIETFRYNFPYMEHGKGRDSQAVCTHTVRSAVTAAREAAPGLPILAGGHSFGGRMTSTAAAELPLEGVGRAGLLRLSAAPARKARHQACRSPRRSQNPDAFPQ